LDQNCTEFIFKIQFKIHQNCFWKLKKTIKPILVNFGPNDPLCSGPAGDSRSSTAARCPPARSAQLFRACALLSSGPARAKTIRSPAAKWPVAQRALRALAVPPPRPGRNLGLGRETSFPPGLKVARLIVAVGSRSMVTRSYRHNKNTSRPPFLET
jgi:hypothetical protein